MENNNQKVIRISKKKLIIVLIILAVLGLVLLFFIQSLGSARMKSSNSSDSGSMIAPDFLNSNYYPEYYRQNSDITDTREFLKTSYYSTLKTRNVSEIVKDVKNAVRDVDGRIDNLTSSEKYGHISFVVPKSRFEEFRSEVEDLVHAKLYTENITSQNLLNEKQSIEERTDVSVAALAKLELEKQNLLTTHNTEIGKINRGLASIQNQLVEVRKQKQLTDDSLVFSSLVNQEVQLTQIEATFLDEKNQENQIYNSKNNLLTQKINQTKTQLANLGKEDTKFENNIETVIGSVDVRWISLWDITKLFSPIHPAIIIILALFLVRWLLVRKGYLSRIEFV